MVTKADILAGLRELGITPGFGLIVHTSLKSFGTVQGGPKTVIEALMATVTPEGTLLMPSFNHATIFQEDGAGCFDPLATPTTNGIVPDTFWRMPGVFRSLNPTHAFAAWGKQARRYTEFHHRTLTMGPQSPLGLLYADDGYGLLIGVGYEANTFHHVVEMSLHVPCLGLRTEAYPLILPDGHRAQGRTWGWRERFCPFTDEGGYYDEMPARGLQREVIVGQSRLILFRLRDCFAVVAEILRTGQHGFPPCGGCPIRSRQISATVKSDWDEQAQRLLPDSAAWNY